MLFENFFEAADYLFLTIFAISLVLGFTAQKTNFCTLGGISDWLNFGSKTRFNAWVTAILTTTLLVGISEYMGWLTIGETFPNFRSSTIPWGQFILGGFLFGFAMTFGSGCGNKTIIRVGEGDINSLIVWGFMGLSAYYMLNPFPDSENTILSMFFLGWIGDYSVELTHAQDIPSFIKAWFLSDDADLSLVRLLTAIGVSGLMVAWIVKTKIDLKALISGAVVGLCATAFWFVSTNISVDVDDDHYTMFDYLGEWGMVYELPEDSEIDEPEDIKPINAAAWRSQSYSFVNPSANALNVGYEFTKKTININYDDEFEYTEPTRLFNMGVFAILGVFIGAILSSLFSKEFHFRFNYSPVSIFKNVISGSVMGIGGVLAYGCTIGQGISGMSTLSIGSLAVLIFIIVGSVAAQKLVYWWLMRD